MRVTTQWLLVPLLLLPLIGCGGGSKGGLDAELKFVPGDSQAVGTARVADILASQAYKDLLAEVAKMGEKSDPAVEFKEQMGIPLADVTTVTFGVSAAPEFTMVMKISKPITADELKKNLKPKLSFAKVGSKVGEFAPPKPEPRQFKEVKVGNYTVHEEQVEFGKGMAFCVVDAHTVVFGEPKPLQAVLQRDKKPELAEGLKKALAKADTSKSICVAVDVQGAMKNVPSAGPGDQNPVAGLQKSAGDVEGAVILASIVKDGDFSVLLLCKSGDAATKIKTEVEGLVALGKLMLGQMAPQLGPMAKDANQVMDSVKVNASGSQVTVTAKGNVVALVLGAVQTMGKSANQTFEKVGAEIKVAP